MGHVNKHGGGAGAALTARAFSGKSKNAKRLKQAKKRKQGRRGSVMGKEKGQKTVCACVHLCMRMGVCVYSLLFTPIFISSHLISSHLISSHLYLCLRIQERRKSFYESTIEMEGYLLKKPRGRTKSWQTRYFVLAGHYLKYYADASKSDVKAVADMNELQNIELNEEVKNYMGAELVLVRRQCIVHHAC